MSIKKVSPEQMKVVATVLRQDNNLVKLFKFSDPQHCSQWEKLEAVITELGVKPNERFEFGSHIIYYNPWQGGGVFVRVADASDLKATQMFVNELLKS